jgi:hypothetical protein
MTFTIVARGASTLPASNNEYASVTVAAAAASVGDIVLITPTSALPRDILVNQSMYVSEVTTNGFTVKSSFKDLSTAITFGYVIINESA